MFLQTSPDIRAAAPDTRKPRCECASVSFWTDSEKTGGMEINIPYNLRRPSAELRKVLKLILADGSDDGEKAAELVDRWFEYEIRLLCQSDKPADKKTLVSLTNKLKLWRRLTKREMPAYIDEPDTAAAPETETQTETKTETKIESRKAERKIDMFNFFENCKDADAARKRYYKLAQVYHSDTGTGDDETMKIINDQFAAYCGKSAAGSDIPELPAGVIALPEHCETPAAVDEAAEYMRVISALVAIPEITVEIVGAWIWVSGDTKAHKDAIKAAGLRFSGQRKEWYWHPVDQTKPARRYRASKLSRDEIRDKYGCTMVKSA